MKRLKLRTKVAAVMAVAAAAALASTALITHPDGERQLDPQVWQAIVADAGLDAVIPEPATRTHGE